MKRVAFVSILGLFFTGLVGVAPASALTDCSQPASQVFAGGTGTLADPYQVHNVQALDEIRCYLDKSFVLTANIVIPAGWGGAAGWRPIGESDPNDFTGSLSGAGHTISGLVIDASVNTDDPSAVGLFGQIRNATLRDFAIAGPRVKGKTTCSPVGTLAGAAQSSRITRVTVSDAVVTANCSAGGLLGQVNRSHLSQINVEADVVIVTSAAGTFGNYFGGLVGSAVESSFSDVDVVAEIKMTTNTSNTAFRPRYVAGLVGEGRNEVVRGARVDFRFVPITNATIQTVAGLIGTNDRSGIIIDVELDAVINMAQAGGVIDAACLVSALDFSDALIDIDARCALTVPASAENVAAAVRYADDGAVMNRVQLNAQLMVGANPTNVGFVTSGANVVLISDSKFTGSMTFETSTTADSVGLISGYVSGGANPIHATNTLFAVSTNLDELGGTNLGGLVGSDNQAGVRVPHYVGFLVDSELLDFTLAPSDLNVETASTANLSSQAFLEARGFDFERTWQSTGSGYPSLRFGPLVVVETVTVSPSMPGLVVSVSGPAAGAGGLLRLVTNYQELSVRVVGLDHTLFTRPVAGGVEVLIPADLSPGSYDLLVTAAGGSARLVAAVVVPRTAEAGVARGWTRAFADGSVKFYARDLVGAGKVRFVLNGQEVAWVRAVDATDPKLNVGPAAARDGLVRTVGAGSRWSLAAGRNVLEIYVDDSRLVRRVFAG